MEKQKIKPYIITGAFRQHTYSGRGNYSAAGFRGQAISDGTRLVGHLRDGYGNSDIWGLYEDSNILVFKKSYSSNNNWFYVLVKSDDFLVGQFSDGDFEDDSHGMVIAQIRENKGAIYETDLMKINEVSDKSPIGYNKKSFVSLPDRLKNYDKWKKFLRESKEIENPRDLEELMQNFIQEIPMWKLVNPK